MYLDNLRYPKYTNQVYSYNPKPKKEDIPFRLEHVFNIETGDYEVNSNQCCYYTPINMVDTSFSTKDNRIVSVYKDSIIAENYGDTDLIINDSIEPYSIRVHVVRDKSRVTRLNGKLYLNKDDMISVETVLHHIYCPHYNNCIFDRDYNINNPIVKQIKEKEKLIKDYKNIIEADRNNEVIYHDTFKDYYKISEDYDVRVPLHFSRIVKDEIKKLNLEIKQLKRKLR